jgi:hypothetical protein
MNNEAPRLRIYPINPLVKNRSADVSEFVDPQTGEKVIIVERGEYDDELMAYTALKNSNLPVFESAFDADCVRYHVPRGTETIRNYMPKISEHLQKEMINEREADLFMPFVELGKLLGKLQENNIRFDSRDNILDKIALAPDFSGRYGLQNFLIPPYDFTIKPDDYGNLDHCLSELRGLRLHKAEHQHLVNSLMVGFLQQLMYEPTRS